MVKSSASAKERSIRQSSVAETLSRPLVGSSRKQTLGSATSSSPTLTRFRWPPEMPRWNSSPMMEWRILSRFSDTRTLLIRRRFSFSSKVAGSRRCAENEMFCMTVSRRCMTSSWGTKPTRDFHRSSDSHSSPLTRITPPVFFTLPKIKFMIVVFPAPDAPMIAQLRPGANFPQGPRMIVTPFGSVKRTSSNSIRKPLSFSSSSSGGVVSSAPVPPLLSFLSSSSEERSPSSTSPSFGPLSSSSFAFSVTASSSSSRDPRWSR
mmetsp:Transcript_13899/g.45364  ORF Transcript_13899/g.45364 Transcript_13899/m.45364 type:complete len:263 (-) Transcript_13899:654-1442(-)